MSESSLLSIYRHSLALLTDLYQLTMAYGYWKTGVAEKEAVFNLFFRRHPFQGGYTIACGLPLAIEFIEQFRYDEGDLAYLATLTGSDGEPLFEPAFLEYLADLKFAGQIDAVEEGTVVFPHEPLIRVRGPMTQCQLLETPLLNLINFQTLVATKSARVCQATEGDPVLEFGLRRAQGIDGGIGASRAAYVGGCAATSNVLAGKLFDIPVKGTHAHSWVMSFDDELESFQAYARAMPNNCVFLVDTYDTLEGVRHAVQVGQWLREQGHEMVGIRLDSGDLAYLSIEARKILDAGGFPKAGIVASNDLDEHLIESLKRQGATISVWGVGTKLATAYDQPALGGVYKLTAVRDPASDDWLYKIKLSEQAIKVTNPGIQQVRRFYRDGLAVADVIYDLELGIPEQPRLIDPMDFTQQRSIEPEEAEDFTDLLVPVFRDGQRVYTPPPLAAARQRTLEQLSSFQSGVRRFVNPHTYRVGLEERLHELKTQLTLEARQKRGHG